jgi:hypothetical protein
MCSPSLLSVYLPFTRHIGSNSFRLYKQLPLHRVPSTHPAQANLNYFKWQWPVDHRLALNQSNSKRSMGKSSLGQAVPSSLQWPQQQLQQQPSRLVDSNNDRLVDSIIYLINYSYIYIFGKFKLFKIN